MKTIKVESGYTSFDNYLVVKTRDVCVYFLISHHHHHHILLLFYYIFFSQGHKPGMCDEDDGIVWGGDVRRFKFVAPSYSFFLMIVVVVVVPYSYIVVVQELLNFHSLWVKILERDFFRLT